MASIASVSPTPTIQRAFDRSISPHSGAQKYVVVWEWETKPHRWRPYSPEVTQLLERAHTKKINKIYLKDADPLLYEYYIDMTNFEQICEPTGEKYPVRREYYALTSPAAKGKFFSEIKFSLVMSTTFEFSRQKLDTKLLENRTFQSIPNLEWRIFDSFKLAQLQF